MQAIDELITDIHDRLDGSGLHFALVVWNPGVPTGLDSVGVAYFPEGSSDAATALALAAVKAAPASMTGTPAEATGEAA
jgi:hypothetical protein